MLKYLIVTAVVSVSAVDIAAEEIPKKEQVMSTKSEQFCKKLHDRVDGLESRLTALKDRVEELPNQSEKALQDHLAKARSKVEDQKQTLAQAQANLKARAEQQANQTKDTIDDWKAKREVKKLNARADRAEAYAADAIDFAVVAIDQAEEAILDAFVARVDADAAAPVAVSR